MKVNVISIKQIIDKLYSVMGVNEELRFNEVLEWMFDGLRYIGNTLQLEKKHAQLKLHNHRALLPCDFKLMEQVSYNGRGVSVGKQTILPHVNTLRNKRNESSQDNIDYHSVSNIYYYLQKDYFIFSLPQGEVNIYYLGYMLDEEGYPFVPDLIEYEEALFAFVLKRLKYGHLFANIIAPQEYEYYDLDFRRKALKATNRLSMPSFDEAQSVGYFHTRLISNIRGHQELTRDISELQRTI